MRLSSPFDVGGALTVTIVMTGGLFKICEWT